MGIIRTVAARLMKQEGMTRCEACRDANVHPTMHLLWTKQAEVMMEQKKHNIRARSLHSGRTHCLLAEHTEALLAFIFELREKGMGVVTIPMVAVKAAQISKYFNDKGPIPLRPQVCLCTGSCLSPWHQRIPALAPGSYRRCNGFHCACHSSEGFGTNEPPQ
jgi:hypothetical protein